jgi:hypothetical protein
VNLRRSTERWFLAKDDNVLMHLRCWCSSTGTSSDLILDRVIRLVKKYDKLDAAKVYIQVPIIKKKFYMSVYTIEMYKLILVGYFCVGY